MKKILLFSLIFVLYSCGNYKIKRELLDFQKYEIVLPETEYISSDLKMVVFYDSLGCSICNYHNLFLWNDIVEYCKRNPTLLSVVFIIAPSKPNVKNLVNAVSQKNKYPVIIDSTNYFLSQNKHFPKDEMYHTFLLDGNNRVLIAGNPVFNEPLYQLYMSTIEQMNEDGMNSMRDVSLNYNNIPLSVNNSIGVDNQLISIGDVLVDSSTQIVCPIMNLTNESIMLSDIVCDCDCISFIKEKNIINPGNKSDITIVFNAKYLGPFYHKISIFDSYSESPLEIAITGRVKKI